MEVRKECIKFSVADHPHDGTASNSEQFNICSIASQFFAECLWQWGENFSEWIFPALCVVIFCVASYFIWWLNFAPLTIIRDLTDLGYYHLSDRKWKKYDRKALINRERRLRKVGTVLPPPFPNGWFSVADSADVPVGKAISVNCLGQNFAIFRSEKGEIHILDALCPHLGANLGIGGVVRGDCIQCPFHLWSFRGTDGQCVDIPYSSQEAIPIQAKLKKWPSFEYGGMIFVWHHVEKDEPFWSLPRVKEIDSGELIYHGRNDFLVNCHIQDIPENGADAGHFPAIHGSNAFTGKDLRNLKKKWRFFGTHKFQSEWLPATEEGQNHIANISIENSTRLFDKFNVGFVNVSAIQMGPGIVQLSINTPFGTMISLETVTPVEAMVQKLSHKFYGPRSLLLFAKLIIWGMTVMLERDIMIWNSKRFNNSPMLVKEDKPIKVFRKWYQQFYSENSISCTKVKDNLDW